jgi:hypothetical protein
LRRNLQQQLAGRVIGRAFMTPFEESPAVFNREREARPSRFLQKLRPQHQALDLVGAAFDFVRVVGEVDVPDNVPRLSTVDEPFS